MQQKHISQLHTSSSYEQDNGASHGCVQTSSLVHPPTRAHIVPQLHQLVSI